MDNKRFREINGYTCEKESNNPDSWFKRAVSFHEAAKILYDTKYSISHHGLLVFSFNAGLSLELILKAILVTNNKGLSYTHTLQNLSEEADIDLDNDQKHLLEFFTSAIFGLVGIQHLEQVRTGIITMMS